MCFKEEFVMLCRLKYEMDPVMRDIMDCYLAAESSCSDNPMVQSIIQSFDINQNVAVMDLWCSEGGYWHKNC